MFVEYASDGIGELLCFTRMYQSGSFACVKKLFFLLSNKLFYRNYMDPKRGYLKKNYKSGVKCNHCGKIV